MYLNNHRFADLIPFITDCLQLFLQLSYQFVVATASYSCGLVAAYSHFTHTILILMAIKAHK